MLWREWQLRRWWLAGSSVVVAVVMNSSIPRNCPVQPTAIPLGPHAVSNTTLPPHHRVSPPVFVRHVCREKAARLFHVDRDI